MKRTAEQIELDKTEKTLVKQRQRLLKGLDKVDKLLAKVRGGEQVVFRLDERPDEAILKA